MNSRHSGALAAVTGASGFIGEALVLHLLARGRGVRALFRAPSELSAALQQHGCGVVLGDLDDERALAALVDGADEGYHCAATMGKTDPALSHRVNVLGTERVARAALAAGVRRFVYVSSTSVYAASRRDDNTYPETFEPEHVERLNHYSRTKHEGERAVRRLAEAEGLRFTIIQPTNGYGLRSRPWFMQWEHLLRRVPVDLVYVKDLVMALEEAASSPAAENEVFNIGHEMVTLSHFVKAVAFVVGWSAKTLQPWVDRGVRAAVDPPAFPFRLVPGGGVGTLARGAFGRPAQVPNAERSTVLPTLADTLSRRVSRGTESHLDHEGVRARGCQPPHHLQLDHGRQGRVRADRRRVGADLRRLPVA